MGRHKSGEIRICSICWKEKNLWRSLNAKGGLGGREDILDKKFGNLDLKTGTWMTVRCGNRIGVSWFMYW